MAETFPPENAYQLKRAGTIDSGPLVLLNLPCDGGRGEAGYTVRSSLALRAGSHILAPGPSARSSGECKSV